MYSFLCIAVNSIGDLDDKYEKRGIHKQEVHIAPWSLKYIMIIARSADFIVKTFQISFAKLHKKRYLTNTVEIKALDQLRQAG